MTQPDFIQIPKPALTDDKLQPADKLLLGYIYWMTKLALMKCVASNSTLAELCGMSERYIQISLTRLEQQGYVRRIFAGDGSHHRVEIECLVAYSAQRTTVRRATNQSSQGVRTTVRHNNISNNKIIESTTNVVGAEAPVAYGKAEINELFNYWHKATGIELQSKRQANRNACNNLLKRYGAEKVRQLIDGVALAQRTEFAPRVADFTQLQAKLNELLVWGKQRQSKGGIGVIR